MRIRNVLPLLLLMAAFGGCVSAPRHVVDFSSVSERQAGGDFTLIVRVSGLTPNGTQAIPGAFVGVVTGTTAIAKDTTDATGHARLVLREHQTVHIVAKASEWTTEQSNALRIGAPGDVPCVGGLCDLTAAKNGQQYGLERNGTVGLVLFPTRIESTQSVKLSPRVVVAGNPVPPGEKWSPTRALVHPDPELAALQMLRFDQARVTLTWTNELLEQADVELGAGCSKESAAKKTSNGTPSFLQGRRTLTLEFDQEHGGYWSDCADFYAGPYLDSVNTAVTFQVKMELQFLGRSTVIPTG